MLPYVFLEKSMTTMFRCLTPKVQLSEEEAALLGKEVFDYTSTQKLPVYAVEGGFLTIWKGKVLKLELNSEGGRWSHIGDEEVETRH
jgi:hypothetical protein